MVRNNTAAISGYRLRSNQIGAALILMMFILGLAASAYVVKSMDVASLRAAQDVKTMQALGEAKKALIAWSVTHATAPGQMPWPDRREVTPPANYDGQSDCSSVSFELKNSIDEPNFLGQIPSVTSTTPCLIYPGVGNSFKDSTNSNLWYAVSRNLVRKYASPATDPIINPQIVQTSTYPWLVVRDKKGNVISDRVAAVIIAPGAPLEGQDRSSDAPPSSAYLDNFTVGGVTYSNRNYDQDDEDFIMGDTTGSSFNDRLVFITIDELMYALEKRVAQEAKQQLKTYFLNSSSIPASRYYPYAAELGDSNHVCKQIRLNGFLPIQPSAATCTSDQACTVNFPMTTVQFTSTSAVSYSASSGSCSYSGNTCSCNGAGTCTRVTPSKTFSCTAGGNCDSTDNGEFKFTYTPKSPDGTITSSACTGGGGSVTCTGAGSFRSVPISSCTHAKEGLEDLPDWFTRNSWQDYIYYAISSDCSVAGAGCQSADLSVGGRSNVHAIVVTTGRALSATEARPLIAQSRPSNLVADYLDSVENVNGDNRYDAISQPRKQIYNDQTFMVAP